MSTDDKPSGDPKSKFVIISGSIPGQTTVDARHRGSHQHLVSVAYRGQSRPLQLGLPGIHEPPTGIISLSFDHLVEVGLTAVIARWVPTYIVDLRIAPTFVPIASRTSDFIQILESSGVTYTYMSEISNRFAGDAWHPELLKNRFISKLRENNHLLERISDWALASRVLVVSADPQTHGSDREIFAEEIRRISASVSWHEI